MSSKQKAAELVNKFYSPEKNVWKSDAKRYAKIVVYEIIKAIDFDCMGIQNLNPDWNEVIAEIEGM